MTRIGREQSTVESTLPHNRLVGLRVTGAKPAGWESKTRVGARVGSR